MKSKTLIKLSLIILCFGLFTQLNAQKGIYLGGSVGPAFLNKTVTDVFNNSYDIKDNNLGYKIFAGWRMNNYVGFEGGYRNLGTSNYNEDTTNLSTRTSGWDVEIMGAFPVGPVDFFAKAGVFFWDGEHNMNNNISYTNGTSFMAGVGVGVRIWRVGIRTEYEFLDFSSENKLGMLSIGATFKLIDMD